MAARLTLLQSRFIDCYLANGGNGTRAAREAGYKGDDNVLAVTAYDNLRNPKIMTELNNRMKASAMSSEEVLFRLSQQAQIDARDLIGLSPDQLKNHPMAAQIKEFEHTVDRIGDIMIQEKIKIKVYDKQAALVHLGKHHGLFRERIEVDWVSELKQAGLDPTEVEDEIVKQFEQHLLSGKK